MKIAGKAFRTIWLAKDGRTVEIIDQTRLPHEFVIAPLATLEDAVAAIRDMQVRGAPLIGVAAAFGVALAMASDPSDEGLANASARLLASRPTAVNLRWALLRMDRLLKPLADGARAGAAMREACAMADEDARLCEAIGEHGLGLIRDLWEKRRAAGAERVNILTHCNAGWLATVDWGTALAPIYKAFEAGIPLHVFADETRPRNQGASLTARELSWHGVPHTVIADNTGGHLMQHGLIDMCIVGSDRTTSMGDVCNKIGTYLKALAAKDNGVPFYVALPGSTVDWTLKDGVAEIPIEERGEAEVSHIAGKGADGKVTVVQLTPDGTRCANYGFDVTPARLVTGLITERGVCAASNQGLRSLFPEGPDHV